MSKPAPPASPLMVLWPLPVSGGARRPKVFRLPFRAEWTPQSRRIVNRLARTRMRRNWPKALRSRWLALAKRRIIPQATRWLQWKYHWRGRVGRSLEAYSYVRYGKGTYLTIGTGLKAEEPLFGKWQGGYVFPIGLHEGIKRHRVWVKRPGIKRPLFEQWVKEHLSAETVRRMNESRYFSLRVFRGGRQKTKNPFLLTAVMQYAPALGDSVADAVDDAIAAGIAGARIH
ncbi:hypothetical protein LCGC14_1749420 [marine sediment metagenome]|uniref:Uncharacterized protein n=1 Tax=marine sediment metagenome TaxID=412755 RepID=A0A0F9JJH3_9ZZZZ